MRIVSLLPSLTELVAALGHRGSLVGVTHECDYPEGVETLPHLTRSRIPEDADSRTIDSLVSAEGGSLYELDRNLLESLRPDLILTQAQCDVCAVNEAAVRQCATSLPGSPHVESVNPTDLAGVHAMFRRIGDLLDARETAESLVHRFESTASTIAHRVKDAPKRRTLLLEWFDPPFTSGHWNPEIVALAGGIEILASAGETSRRIGWDDVQRSNPEVIVLAPCGFTLERSRRELATLTLSGKWTQLSAVQACMATLVDGSAFFARPGPRLEESLRIAAAAIHSDRCADLAPSSGWSRMV